MTLNNYKPINALFPARLVYFAENPPEGTNPDSVKVESFDKETRENINYLKVRLDLSAFLVQQLSQMNIGPKTLRQMPDSAKSDKMIAGHSLEIKKGDSLIKSIKNLLQDSTFKLPPKAGEKNTEYFTFQKKEAALAAYLLSEAMIKAIGSIDRAANKNSGINLNKLEPGDTFTFYEDGHVEIQLKDPAGKQTQALIKPRDSKKSQRPESTFETKEAAPSSLHQYKLKVIDLLHDTFQDSRLTNDKIDFIPLNPNEPASYGADFAIMIDGKKSALIKFTEINKIYGFAISKGNEPIVAFTSKEQVNSEKLVQLFLKRDFRKQLNLRLTGVQGYEKEPIKIDILTASEKAIQEARSPAQLLQAFQSIDSAGFTYSDKLKTTDRLQAALLSKLQAELAKYAKSKKITPEPKITDVAVTVDKSALKVVNLSFTLEGKTKKIEYSFFAIKNEYQKMSDFGALFDKKIGQIN